MSEKLYAIKESTMAAIAASLRDVAGTTEPINGDEISGYVTTTLPTAILSNLDEVLEDQDDIIAQIQTALQGKASSSDPVLQEKTVSPSTSAQTVTPDSNYDGLSKVTVNAIPSTYVKPSYIKTATTYIPTTVNQTISAGTYLNDTQTIKGDTNLVAGNIKSGVSIFGVNGTYAGSGGGDTSMEDGLITGQITSYINDRVTTIGNYAFLGCSSLTTISFPNVVSIGNSAFADCNKLTTISFPVCTFIDNLAFANCNKLTIADFPNTKSIGINAFKGCYELLTISFPNAVSIGSSAFYNCYKLTTANFPSATGVNAFAFYSCSGLSTANFPTGKWMGSYAFAYCNNLTTANFPNVNGIGEYAFTKCNSLTIANFPNATYISYHAFDACSNLTTASFPACTYIYGYAFSNCSSLTTVSFPVCRNIDTYAFANCSSLTTISFPVCTSISNSAFAYCNSLTTANFPNAATIGYSTFYGCKNLKSLYLTGSSVCRLMQSNAFTSTPIGGYSTVAGTYGSIFVPASLVDAYKSATNWTYFSSRISYCGIGLIDDNSIAVSTTKNIAIDTHFLTTPENISVISQNNDMLSISNVQFDTNNITFDATAFNVEGEAEILISATDGDYTYEEIRTLNIHYPI